MDIIAKTENHQVIQAGITALIKSEYYQSLSNGHFWYLIENEHGSFEGVLTGVLASKAHNITTHEAVLEQRVQLFSDYLTAVGFQAEPVLLMHENNQAAAE